MRAIRNPHGPAALDLNLLLAFEAIHQTGSVTAAAARMGVTQPAMSATLARLRRMLDDELFVPTGRGVRPTPRATELAGGVLSALDRLRDAIQPPSAAPAPASRTFTIGTTDFTSMVLLPTLVPRLRRLAPSITLRAIAYRKDDLGEMLRDGEADLALGVFPQPPPDSVVTPLYSERFVGVARRGHAVLSGALTPERYAAQRHALVSVNNDARGEIDVALEALGLSRVVELVLPQMTVLPQILAHTDLIAAVPHRMARQFADAALVTFEIPLPLRTWTVHMLWHASSRRSPAHRWLREQVLAEARSV